VSISSEVSPTIREFERTSTTIANVYVQARVESYLCDLKQRLDGLKFGGSFFHDAFIAVASQPSTQPQLPIRLLEFGPAAGALRSRQLRNGCGYPNLVSFDMGGTTAKSA